MADSGFFNEQQENAKLDQAQQVNNTNKQNRPMRDVIVSSWADRYLPYIWAGLAFAVMLTIMFPPPLDSVAVAGQRAIASPWSTGGH